MDPSIWGPHLWTGLHYVALGYPGGASATDRAHYKAFYEGLSNVLPCGKCVQHYIQLLKESPIDAYLDTADTLFEWTVIIHNAVNKRLGKKEVSLEQAKTLYPAKRPDPVGGNGGTCMYWVLTSIFVTVIIACAYATSVKKV